MKGLSGIGAEIEVRLDCNFVYCFMTFFLVTYSQNILIFHQGKIAQINSKRNKNIIQTGIQKCINTKYVMIFSVSSSFSVQSVSQGLNTVIYISQPSFITNLFTPISLKSVQQFWRFSGTYNLYKLTAKIITLPFGGFGVIGYKMISWINML